MLRSVLALTLMLMLGCGAPSQQIAADVAVARTRSDRLLRLVTPTCREATNHERCERLVQCLEALGALGTACEPGISAQAACSAAQTTATKSCREWP